MTAWSNVKKKFNRKNLEIMNKGGDEHSPSPPSSVILLFLFFATLGLPSNKLFSTGRTDLSVYPAVEKFLQGTINFTPPGFLNIGRSSQRTLLYLMVLQRFQLGDP